MERTEVVMCKTLAQAANAKSGQAKKGRGTCARQEIIKGRSRCALPPPYKSKLGILAKASVSLGSSRLNQQAQLHQCPPAPPWSQGTARRSGPSSCPRAPLICVQGRWPSTASSTLPVAVILRGAGLWVGARDLLCIRQPIRHQVAINF